MDLATDATFELDGEFDWSYVDRRVTLPEAFPLPRPAGRVVLRIGARIASDGTASLELRVRYRMLGPPAFFGGLVELAPEVELTLTAGFASDAELDAARAQWDSPTPQSRLEGRLSGRVGLRIAALPQTLPVRLRLGNPEGWIGVDFEVAAATNGAALTLAASDLGELAFDLPGLPLASPPLAATVDVVSGQVTFDGGRWSGQLAVEGRCRLAPRVESAEVALLGLIAPLLDGVTLEGALGARLELTQKPRFTAWSRFDNSSVGIDVLALLAELGRGLTGAVPGAGADLRGHSGLAFRLRGVALAISADDPRLAIDLEAGFGGVVLPAHLELSTREVRAGLGGSSLAAPGAVLELPLRVPHVTGADLGYPQGVRAARTQAGDKPFDQWIWDRVRPAERGRYDAAVESIVAAIASLTGAAAGVTGPVHVRRTANGWQLVVNPAAPQPGAEAPFVVGLAAVQTAAQGRWTPSGDLALVTRVDGVWQVLIAAPRLRFEHFAIEFDLRNPRRSSIGGRVAFAFSDGEGNEHEIAATAELAADAVLFSVEQLSAPPIAIGGAEVSIARMLLGFGYTKRSLAFSFAGSLELPPALLETLDTSDEIGIGLRVPQRTQLDVQFEVMPLYVGKAVIPIPLFQFDWDGRRRVSPPLADAARCEPHWDGLQLIVDGIARVGLKRLSFSPLLGCIACANSDFDGDLALGTSETGLTIVADNLFWPWGQDSGAANTLFLAGVHMVPYGDNFCVSLRAHDFRLHFHLQRPVPTMSPLALFELIALVVDPMYPVAPRGALADSLRISLTHAVLELPAALRRLFPLAEALHAKPVEKTLNLADFIRLVQGAIGALRSLVRAVAKARDDASRLVDELAGAASALQSGGLATLLADAVGALPAELRSTRLDAAFGRFEGEAVIVLADADRAGEELRDRASPGSAFGAELFAPFDATDLEALGLGVAATTLAPAEVTPALLQSIARGENAVTRVLKRALSAGLRQAIADWRPPLVPAALQWRLADELNRQLEGEGRGRSIASRRVARKLGLPAAAEQWVRRGVDAVHYNRALLGAATPGTAARGVVAIAAADLRVARSQRLAWLGRLNADGRFLFVSRLGLQRLELAVAGIEIALPLELHGRLALSGRAGPHGVSCGIEGEAHADWNPLPGLATLSLGSARSPLRLRLDGNGGFRFAGEGALSVGDGALVVRGQADLAHTHARLDGRLRRRLGSAVAADLALAGHIGPGQSFLLSGQGSLRLFAMPLADVEAALSERELRLAARLVTDAWKVPGREPAPVAIDARLAGAAASARGLVSLRLEGHGSVRLFDAEVAEARVGVEVRQAKGKTGNAAAPQLAVWFEGALAWHGRDWLGARVELQRTRASLRGRSTLSAELTLPASDLALVASLAFDASVTLRLPGGALDDLTLVGEWWVGLRRGSGTAAVRVPVAVGRLPRLEAKDLPRLLVALPGLVLPRAEALGDWPLPTIEFEEDAFDLPSSVKLPRLDTFEGLLGGLTKLFVSGYDSADERPDLALEGIDTLMLPSGFKIVWPDDAAPAWPFDRVDGFAVVLDWDEDAKSLVLRAEGFSPDPARHGRERSAGPGPRG